MRSARMAGEASEAEGAHPSEPSVLVCLTVLMTRSELETVSDTADEQMPDRIPGDALGHGNVRPE